MLDNKFIHSDNHIAKHVYYSETNSGILDVLFPMQFGFDAFRYVDEKHLSADTIVVGIIAKYLTTNLCRTGNHVPSKL